VAGDKYAVVVRMPSELQQKIDKLKTQAQKQRGARWSQNDQIVLMLERAAEERVK
jgi:hypothetical protein